MGMNRKYSGFTLVEMLIVMGIIIILMAVGIAAGRFAINRANDVAHQNAADQLFVAAQSYLTDEREYPIVTNWSLNLTEGTGCTAPCLGGYLSLGEFRGGTDATYYYWTDQKSALVCVSLGGVDDADNRGYYCTGNGFGATGAPAGVTQKDVDPESTTADGFPGTSVAADWNLIQDWDNENDVFETI
ncbi:MAG: hypothetical protein UR84_C0004G0029 [candidate division WS6 bacterium GW2011_GWD1_35_594]|uniref:Type II secretion system protein n=1 Tax=candidate division WS6 bacterium GW2011_GWB1_33_6 TaxID=1619088 RepID=A0A0G0DJA1_9BACT|nr:MAG: hypothetical protein UR47_C0001G0028 [candidate division WS6 bacterium GW2011_GWB1_33_6]KKP82358.1 MAG: hypothetical protein UR84_C0004G0029 [candidate division WS6 bacterium GW2011_GWD1_35_594]OGC36501.1 MAG: hypothetical protein A2369_01150 [candidate division WS6 bacterium RIFOXYB1_FULL_33_15]OGC37892.1 MAG: hypothetical protein A2436_01165 [candidate division WS6 bacterium RIFOXYC1_FULL_33_9]